MIRRPMELRGTVPHRGAWSPVLAVLLCAVGMSIDGPVQAEPLSLADCIRLALARSPAAQAAGFEVGAAAARVRAARSAYIPRLRAEGEYGRSQGFDETVTNGGVTSTLLTVEAILLDGGLRDAQFAAARARLRSATAIAQQRRADIAFAVRGAYFAALAARAEGTVHGDSVRTLRDYVALLHRQEALGLVPGNDALRAQLAVETGETARRLADAQVATARNELATLTGIDVAPEALGEPGPMPAPELTDARIDASPVLTDARATAEAARSEADAARSEWRGHVTVTASGGALGVQPAATFHDHGGGQFLFGVTMPLYDGGGISARVAAAVAAISAAEANVEQARQTMHVALVRARTQGRRALEDVAAWQQAIPRAQDNFGLIRARYFGGGNVRLLEVLDALNLYVDARVRVSESLLAYRLATSTEEQILGEVPP